MMRRACIVVSSEMTVRNFLVRHLASMQPHFDVTVVVNTRNARFLEELGLEARLHALRIERRVAPLADLRCLIALIRLMWTERFDLVHSVTPKAGLLAMTAAWLARIPVRIHTFTGQVWATRTGMQRTTLRWLDRAIAATATATLADSASQREFLVQEGVVQPSRILVLGSGSISGVDRTRFRPDPAARARIRESLGIPQGGVVLLFAGRIHREKGVLDLARAFATLAEWRDDLHLLVVGPDEQHLIPAIRDICRRHAARLHFCDFTPSPEHFMAASDILCLPSYREGFGNVVIEAAAAGLPTVASRIYGIVDAVVDETTGLLHDAADVAGLTERVQRLVSNAHLRWSLGAAARDRVGRLFCQHTVAAAVLDFYLRLVDARDIAARPSRGHAAPVGTQPTVEPAPQPRATGWYSRFGKRTFDMLGAGTGIVLLLPLFALLSLMIRLGLGAPVLFRQTRPGLNGVPFTLVKFRSMADRRGADGTLLPDADRLTPFGRFLRATSLDELPELWNVLIGTMSLVGPRPLLVAYLERYTPRQALRHRVRPGITGLAQISGRNALAWERKFELDVEYVERCSFALDLRILAATVWQVLLRKGISQDGHATAEEFLGLAAPRPGDRHPRQPHGGGEVPGPEHSGPVSRLLVES